MQSKRSHWSACETQFVDSKRTTHFLVHEGQSLCTANVQHFHTAVVSWKYFNSISTETQTVCNSLSYHVWPLEASRGSTQPSIIRIFLHNSKEKKPAKQKPFAFHTSVSLTGTHNPLYLPYRASSEC